MGDRSLSTYPACLGFKQVIEKEDRQRRAYYLGRFSAGGATGEQQDPYDNERVPPLHPHRTMITSVTLSMESREREPLTERLAHADTIVALSRGQGTASAPLLPRAPAADARPPPCSDQTSQEDVSGCSTSPHYGVTPPPAMNLPRRSASAMGAAADGTRAFTSTSTAADSFVGRGGDATSSRRSGRSRATVMSMRSRIGEAVQEEVARSSLGDYISMLQQSKDRERNKRLAMPLHLRTGPSPVYMGHPATTISESLRASTLPVQMAVDPKWSTEIKKMNYRAGQRIQYEDRQSASVAMLPEVPFMYPKRHVSNPPTPYFKPGQRQPA